MLPLQEVCEKNLEYHVRIYVIKNLTDTLPHFCLFWKLYPMHTCSIHIQSFISFTSKHLPDLQQIQWLTGESLGCCPMSLFLRSLNQGFSQQVIALKWLITQKWIFLKLKSLQLNARLLPCSLFTQIYHSQVIAILSSMKYLKGATISANVQGLILMVEPQEL